MGSGVGGVSGAQNSGETLVAARPSGEQSKTFKCPDPDQAKCRQLFPIPNPAEAQCSALYPITQEKCDTAFPPPPPTPVAQPREPWLKFKWHGAVATYWEGVGKSRSESESSFETRPQGPVADWRFRAFGPLSLEFGHAAVLKTYYDVSVYTPAPTFLFGDGEDSQTLALGNAMYTMIPGGVNSVGIRAEGIIPKIGPVDGIRVIGDIGSSMTVFNALGSACPEFSAGLSYTLGTPKPFGWVPWQGNFWDKVRGVRIGTYSAEIAAGQTCMANKEDGQSARAGFVRGGLVIQGNNKVLPVMISIGGIGNIAAMSFVSGYQKSFAAEF